MWLAWNSVEGVNTHMASTKSSPPKFYVKMPKHAIVKAPWQLCKLISHRILSMNFWPNQRGAGGRRNICKRSGKGVEKWNFGRPSVGQLNIDSACRLRQADLNDKHSHTKVFCHRYPFIKIFNLFHLREDYGQIQNLPQPLTYATAFDPKMGRPQLIKRCYTKRQGAKWPHSRDHDKGHDQHWS